MSARRYWSEPEHDVECTRGDCPGWEYHRVVKVVPPDPCVNCAAGLHIGCKAKRACGHCCDDDRCSHVSVVEIDNDLREAAMAAADNHAAVIDGVLAALAPRHVGYLTPEGVVLTTDVIDGMVKVYTLGRDE